MISLERAGLATVAAGALLLGGLFLREHKKAEAAAAAQQEVIRLQGERHALDQAVAEHAALANQARQEAADKAKAAAASGARAEDLKAKLQRALAAQAPGVVDGGAPAVDSPDALRDQIIEAQGQQIQDQAGQIGALTRQVGEQQLELDGKDRVIENLDRQVRGLELALDAQKSAARTGKWLGRLQGFAVGVASGYIAGKVHP